MCWQRAGLGHGHQGIPRLDHPPFPDAFALGLHPVDGSLRQFARGIYLAPRGKGLRLCRGIDRPTKLQADGIGHRHKLGKPRLARGGVTLPDGIHAFPKLADHRPEGMALRGGGPAVQLLISGSAEDDAFPGEWVAIHEFLHHAMPFVQRDDAWLSEGFVTYYTEVLLARMGFQSERESWQALLAGFGRGQRGGTGQSLAEESRQMHVNHAYQRVYWGGAAIALLADVTLREAGGSLDDAMRALQRCCAATLRIWPSGQILQALDDSGASHGYPSLTALSGPILRSADFPDLTPIYRKLGVSMVNGEPTLDESAPIAPLRRAIFTQPRP